MTRQDRSVRLRRGLELAKEARVAEVEAYLQACGWTRRQVKGGHRAWVKAGKRTLVIPIHGTRVREYVIRQVLEETGEEGEDQD